MQAPEPHEEPSTQSSTGYSRERILHEPRDLFRAVGLVSSGFAPRILYWYELEQHLHLYHSDTALKVIPLTDVRKPPEPDPAKVDGFGIDLGFGSNLCGTDAINRAQWAQDDDDLALERHGTSRTLHFPFSVAAFWTALEECLRAPGPDEASPTRRFREDRFTASRDGIKIVREKG